MKTLTEQEYQELRNRILKKSDLPLTTELTCDDCGARLYCEFAADTYNTNGDCLAEK